MAKANVNTIWNGEWFIDEEFRNNIKEDMIDSGRPEEEIRDIDIDYVINDYLEDERANLDIRIDGIIIAYADLGLWDGRHKAIKIFRDNISTILFSNDCYYPHWYVDRYNVRATMPHHDGTNHVLYRVAKDKETAERIAYDTIWGGKGEDYFKRNTKSLRPYVAEVYGW